ncbi:hypothetical protein [Microbulbifer mangrovi]|uniref:hypothetical protein n=1 Tax=Microbulbifer mangrovi TaxID=927787 RepID=UPI0009904317|nr:hypothetical protein [Microbulbifer mangrovi]
MSNREIFKNADKAMLKVAVLVLAFFGAMATSIISLYEHTELIGTVCCIAGATNKRSAQGILVKVTLDDKKVVRVHWKREVLIKKDSRAVIGETTNRLTGGVQYVFKWYLPDA